jgi:hypothetical protein
MPSSFSHQRVVAAFRRAFTRPRNLTLFAATLASTAFYVIAVTPVVDPDVWWVAAAGRITLAAGAVPTTNVFSFAEPAHPWVMHEWLLGPIYALAVGNAGPRAFVAIALVVAALQLALLLGATVGRARHLGAGLGVALAAMAFFGGRFLSARPTGVSLLFPLVLTPLAVSPRFSIAAAVAAVAVELLWSNTHGSFPLGIALLVLGAWDGAGQRRLRLATAGAAAAATLVNPYGLRLHRFVWSYFRGGEGIYREIHAHIVEFGSIASAWGRTVGPVDVCGLLLVGAVCLGALRDRRFFVRAGFCLLLLASALLHVRHFELAGLVTCILLVPFVDDRVEAWARTALPSPAALRPNATELACVREGKRQREREQEPTSRRRLATALVLLPACALGVGTFVAAGRARAPAEWIADGEAVVPLLAAVPDGAHLYAPFQKAGLAIWYDQPRGVGVLFDSRNDCYSAATFRAYLALDDARTTPERVEALLDGFAVDAALLPEDHSLVKHLSRDARWSRSRTRDRWMLFERIR